ncbi:autophagy protein-like protein Atg27 [Xylogone sp. PMI_703]|nr:autophagy protein-like protein Atg27 [Xylogone sp. PMI_703]
MRLNRGRPAADSSSSSSTKTATLLSALLFPLLAAAVGNIDCHNVVVEKKAFDLSPLGGPRSALQSVPHEVTFDNTTWTIDICRPLKRAKDEPKDEQCVGGTRVCGIERVIKKTEKIDTVMRVINIAGELKGNGGGDMDAKWTLLSSSPLSSDVGKQGLRVVMNGGFDKETKRPQRASVEFLCDKDRDGTENLWKGEDVYDDDAPEERRRAAAEEGEGEGGDEKDLDDGPDSPSLQFVNYNATGDVDTLYLKWRTKYACEDAKDEQDASNEHWGFFTWFIIIAFLSTAAYLIFGSWLNYNRYGARGWDLLPHSDTIRDVPYLLKDWLRKVLSTLQGGGSRGGYAAV